MSDDDIIPLRTPKMIATVGGPVDETRVTLALYAEDLDPDQVSSRLGCAPTKSHKRGDVRPQSERARSAGAMPSPPARQGAWFLTVEGVAPQGPDELITLLLSRFPNHVEFWAPLARDYKVQVRVGIHTSGWYRGFHLQPETVALVAITTANLGFDLYFYGEEDSGS